MSFMVVHTELDECVQCLLQSSLFGLVRWLYIVAHRVGPGNLHRSLIIVSVGEIWMTPPPRVVGVCISVKMWLALIVFMKLICSGSYKFCEHILAL